jgi:hypothetical protein
LAVVGCRGEIWNSHGRLRCRRAWHEF